MNDIDQADLDFCAIDPKSKKSWRLMIAVAAMVIGMPITGFAEYTVDEREAAWEEFANERGLGVPDSWSDGINWADAGLTKLPSKRYPAGTVTGSIVLTRNNLSGADLMVLQGLHIKGSLAAPHNNISELSFMDGTTVDGFLGLRGNEIVDIAPLEGYRTTKGVHLADNRIVDISPLHNVDIGGFLNISNNKVTNFSPLGEAEFGHVWTEGNITHENKSLFIPIPLDSKNCEPERLHRFMRYRQRELCPGIDYSDLLEKWREEGRFDDK